MTARHPMDCYITPPEAAMALGVWLSVDCWFVEHDEGLSKPLWLDPFAGPGTLIPWMTGLPGGEPDPNHFAFELDMRWAEEQRAYVLGTNQRLGHDSLKIGWTVRGGQAPHIATNIPFGETSKALARCRQHAYGHGRYAAVLMRTDWWQHRERSRLRPDHMLMLEWRPAFGYRWDKKAQRLVWSTDYAGYVWCVYEPTPTGKTELEFLARPKVPKALSDEHKRLARLAYNMGAASALGV